MIFIHKYKRKRINPLAGLTTIDVEPDNVWAHTHSKQYNNIGELPMFHDLCRRYGVRPTYLVTWAIASDTVSANILERLLRMGDCEIGIHPHLWETPPFIESDKANNASVGPEYSIDILQEKIFNLVDLVKQRFGQPRSHRAGRWGIDVRQVQILSGLGICVDSSVIPGVNWSSTGILDHSLAPCKAYQIDNNSIFCEGLSGLLEVPCTIKPGLQLFGFEKNMYMARLLNRAGFGARWLRASKNNDSKQLIRICQWAAQNTSYLNIMSHSSEFLAGGSPYWVSDAEIKHHFSLYHHVFSWWQKNEVIPQTLSEFCADYFSSVPGSKCRN